MRKFRARAEQLYLFIRIALRRIVSDSRVGCSGLDFLMSTEPAVAACATAIRIVAEMAIAIAENAIPGDGETLSGVGECAIVSVGCQIIFRRIPSTKIHIMCLMR